MHRMPNTFRSTFSEESYYSESFYSYQHSASIGPSTSMRPYTYQSGSGSVKQVPVTILNARQTYQEKIFTKFINAKLQKLNLSVTDFFADIANGELLSKFVQIATGKSEQPSVSFKWKIRSDKLKTVESALRILVDEKIIKANDFSAADIVGKDEPKILQLVWKIISGCYFSSYNDSELPFYPVSPDFLVKKNKKLCDWVNRRIATYCLSEIKDFDYDFQNGMIFAALVHSHRPELIDWDRIKNERHILDKVFEVIAQHYNISPLFLTDQLLNGSVDQRLVVLFLEMLQTEIEAQEKAVKKVEKDEIDSNWSTEVNPPTKVPRASSKTVEPVEPTQVKKTVSSQEEVKPKPKSDITEEEMIVLEEFTKHYNNLSKYLEKTILEKKIDQRYISEFLDKLRKEIDRLERLMRISETSVPAATDEQQTPATGVDASTVDAKSAVNMRDASGVIDVLKQLENVFDQLVKSQDPVLDGLLVEQAREKMNTLQTKADAFLGSCVGTKQVELAVSKGGSLFTKLNNTWIYAGSFLLILIIVLSMIKLYLDEF